jgi:hypothetical protein
MVEHASSAVTQLQLQLLEATVRIRAFEMAANSSISAKMAGLIV